MSLRHLHISLWSRLVCIGLLVPGALAFAVDEGGLKNRAVIALHHVGQELFFVRSAEAGSSREAALARKRMAEARKRAAQARKRAAQAQKRAAEARKRAAEAARKRAAAAQKRAAEARKRAAVAARKRAAAARKRAAAEAAARKRAAAAARKRAAAARKRAATARNKSTKPTATKVSAPSGPRTQPASAPAPVVRTHKPAAATAARAERPVQASTEPSTEQAGEAPNDSQPAHKSAKRATASMPPPEVPGTLIGIFERLAQPVARPKPATQRKRVRRPANVATRQAARPSPAPTVTTQSKQPSSTPPVASELPWAKPRPASQPVIPAQTSRQQTAARRSSAERRANRLERRRRREARRIAGFNALPAHRFGSSRNTVRNEILVERLHPTALKRAAALGFKPLSATVGSGTNHGVVRLRTPAGASTQTAYRLLTNLFDNGTVHFNRRYRVYQATQGSGWHTTVKSQERRTCSSERCYGPATVRWRSHLSRCAQGLRIGIVDTAIATRHPAFVGQNITTARIAKGRPPGSNDGHGTGILALLAGNPNSTTPGLVPDASFFAADIFFRDGDGNPTSDSLTLHKALLQMEAWNVQIINLSLAGPPDSLVEKTIQRLSRKGVMFVAAGGNEGPSAGPSYPAAYDDVIAVTAVDRSLRGYRYANRGEYIDVAAPGVNIWTAAPNDKDALLSGTSLAAPFVTSIVSAVYRALPNKSRAELLSAIATQDLGHPGKDKIYGRGLVRAPLNCRPKVQPRPRIANTDQRDFAAVVFVTD